MESKSNLFFLYEPGHVEVLERFFATHPDLSDGAVVVAYDLLTEERLTEKGIPAVSGSQFVAKDIERFVMAERWPVTLFENKAWEWFAYRDVPLYKIFLHPMQAHLMTMFHWTSVIDACLKQHRAQRLYVFETTKDMPLISRPLMRELHNAAATCAKVVGARRGVSVEVIPTAARVEPAARRYRMTVALQQFFVRVGATLLNMVMTLVPRKRGVPRILVNDYWRNIQGVVEALPAAEIVFFDRKEIKYAGLGNILRFRMQLFNFGTFSTARTAADREAAARDFRAQWEANAEALLPECSYKDISLKPILRESLTQIVSALAPEALEEIDAAYALLERVKPTLVLLRTSISMQLHFPILALVARNLRIPSLELQHGLEYFGPGSLSKGHLAEYIGVYGKAVQDEMVGIGFKRDKLPIIGSPRFDHYANYPHDVPRQEGFTVLCMASMFGDDGGYSAYDARTNFERIAEVLEKMPGAKAIIKMRPGSRPDWYWRMIETIFARVPHQFVSNEPFSQVLPEVDAVVSHYSTAALEVLQCGKPLVLFGMLPYEQEAIRYHFSRYAQEGALKIALSPEELERSLTALHDTVSMRESLSMQALKTMQHFHSFDGHASQRIVALLNRFNERAV